MSVMIFHWRFLGILLCYWNWIYLMLFILFFSKTLKFESLVAKYFAAEPVIFFRIYLYFDLYKSQKINGVFFFLF